MAEENVVSEHKAKRTWQEVAAELSKEHDPQKVITLSRELNEAMLEEERRKAQERLKASGQ
jgi:ribosomal protein L31E